MHTIPTLAARVHTCVCLFENITLSLPLYALQRRRGKGTTWSAQEEDQGIPLKLLHLPLQGTSIRVLEKALPRDIRTHPPGGAASPAGQVGQAALPAVSLYVPAHQDARSNLW